jgi:hypothetical protein
MEVSGQPHDPAALPLMIEPFYPLNWRLDISQKREKSLVPARNQIPIVQPIAQLLYCNCIVDTVSPV